MKLILKKFVSFEYEHCDILDENGASIVSVNGSRWSKIVEAIDISYAEEIVAAVNSYDLLLVSHSKLLKAARKAFEALDDNALDGTMTVLEAEALQLLEVAIADAALLEGEKS